MEHPKGVLSQREQAKVDDPERKPLGKASKRLLMATMGSSMQNAFDNVKTTLKGGALALTIGAAGVGAATPAMASDEVRRANLATVFTVVTGLAKGAQDGHLSFGDVASTIGGAAATRALISGSEGGATYMAAAPAVQDGLKALFGAFGGQGQKATTQHLRDTEHTRIGSGQARAPATQFVSQQHRPSTPQGGLPTEVGYSTAGSDASKIVLTFYDLEKSGNEIGSARFENTPRGQAQMNAKFHALEKQTTLVNLDRNQ